MKEKRASDRNNQSWAYIDKSCEAGSNEKLISRLIYGVVLFAFFYFGMGTILFVFFR